MIINITHIICTEKIEEKLEVKHGVILKEVRQLLLGKPRVRFAEKGYVRDEDVYAAFGQTFAGRYLAVFFIYKPKQETAIIMSARDMADKERTRYAKK